MHGELKPAVRKFIIALFIFAYAGLNYYLGWRGWEAFGSYIFQWQAYYWGMLGTLAFAYFFGHFLNRYSPGRVSDVLLWTGAYWMGFFFYALLTVVLIDILRFMDNFFGFLPAAIKNSPTLVAVIILIFLAVLMLYGTYNSRRPVLRKYRITIPAPSKLKNLKAVLVSDVHLGNIIGRGRLEGLVKKINKRQPDIVFFAGDIIDGDIRPFEEQKMGLLLSKIKSRYGAFAVMGNHEYLGGQYKELIKALEKSDIKVLRDEQFLLKNSLYIIGRDDKYSRNRKSLADLMAELETQLPVIVLDHNPADIEEAAQNHVDLQLSGHTHTGQMWPLNYITARIFATDWGYLKKGSLQVIVSNGYATWGPPIRIGNRPELVEIIIRFR
ncbi:MAG: metallophosphoesterase [Syntrophomonadaceae bacterium]|jgi:predicted MPP superfamily phosphohydrolase|nr:metallophosphoesterase [Syntrophomonadaceae bacterium]